MRIGIALTFSVAALTVASLSACQIVRRGAWRETSLPHLTQETPTQPVNATATEPPGSLSTIDVPVSPATSGQVPLAPTMPAAATDELAPTAIPASQLSGDELIRLLDELDREIGLEASLEDLP